MGSENYWDQFPRQTRGYKFPKLWSQSIEVSSWQQNVGNSRQQLAIVGNPARKSTPLSSCSPQAEDSFYPQKMENPLYFLPFLESTRNGMPGGIRLEESSKVTSQGEYSFLPPKTECPPHSLCLRRVLQKRSSIGIPFKES